MKIKNRVISFLLAALMLVTFALPASAMNVDPVQDVIDMTGGAEIVFGGEDSPPAQEDNESADANAPPSEPDNPPDDSKEPDMSGTAATAEASPAATESGNFLLDCTPEQAAKLIAYYEFIKEQIALPMGIQPFSAPGDSGTVSWEWGEAVGIEVPSGDPNNPYYIGNIPRLTLSTANPPIGRPFCVEFGVDPGGAYPA